MPNRRVFRERQPDAAEAAMAVLGSHGGKKTVRISAASVDRGYSNRLTARNVLAAAARRWTRRTEREGEQQATASGPRSTLLSPNVIPFGGVRTSPASSQTGYRRSNSSQTEDFLPPCMPVEVERVSLRSDEEMMFIKDYIGKVWDHKTQKGKKGAKGKHQKPRHSRRASELQAVLKKHDLDKVIGFEGRIGTRGRRPSIVSKAGDADDQQYMLIDESRLVLESDEEYDGDTEFEGGDENKPGFPVRTSAARNEHWVIAKLRSLASPNPNDNGVGSLYGGQEAVFAEKVRFDSADHLVVHPYSALKLVWDAWMLLLSLATLLGVPFGVTFDDVRFYRDWISVCVFVDCCGICDVVLNFRTGTIEAHNWRSIVLDPDNIVKSYLSGYFVRDLTCCVPWDFLFMLWNRNFMDFYSNAAQQLRARQAIAVLSCVRLLTIFRYLFLVKKTLVLRSRRYACWLMSVAEFVPVIHTLACLHMAVPRYEGFPDSSWVVREKLLTMPLTEQYSRCLVRALTITGPAQAYGKDTAPFPVLELYLSTGCSVIGAYYFIVFVRRFYAGGSSKDFARTGSCEGVPIESSSSPDQTTMTSTPFNAVTAFQARNPPVRLVTRGVGGCGGSMKSYIRHG